MIGVALPVEIYQHLARKARIDLFTSGNLSNLYQGLRFSSRVLLLDLAFGGEMATEDKRALELALGVVIIQSALCDFMIESGTIKLESLIGHLVARRAVWESTASETTLFPVDVLLSMLQGQQSSTPVGSIN
jgi:hypothetical protein